MLGSRVGDRLKAAIFMRRTTVNTLRTYLESYTHMKIPMLISLVLRVYIRRIKQHLYYTYNKNQYAIETKCKMLEIFYFPGWTAVVEGGRIAPDPRTQRSLPWSRSIDAVASGTCSSWNLTAFECFSNPIIYVTIYIYIFCASWRLLIFNSRLFCFSDFSCRRNTNCFLYTATYRQTL